MTNNVSLKAKIGNVEFSNLMFNAAGVSCMTTEELDQVLASTAGSVITKSATLETREGNELPRLKEVPLGSINSMGLPNYGLDYYIDYAVKQQGNAKPVVLSVAGLSIDENIKMLKKVQESDFNGLTELNLSCPNVKGKSQIGYDFEDTDRTLEAMFAFFKKPLGLKLPPYFDFNQFDAIAEVLNKYPITYVNVINSIGNGLVIDTDTESVVIKPKGGFGGLGGDYVKPTALANVRALRMRLRDDISLIGTGGIKNGMDVFEHVLCGADCVQVGTALLKEGPQVFERLTNELVEIMTEKGYNSLDEFRGQLKVID